MKRILALFLILTMLCPISVFAENAEEWTCPSCDAVVTGNFCSKCGEKRPDDGTWICPNCGADCDENFCSNCGTKRPDGEVRQIENEGKIRLDLSIAFEKNAYFSTYDVKLFVDDEWITTMRHGIDFAETLYVDPGRHVILFREDSTSYPAEVSTIINIAEPTLYQCEIHAKMDVVQITGERMEIIEDDLLVTYTNKEYKVDGNLKLQVSIEFRKNGIFSQYDVDLYCDDTFIATLPHGKNFEGTLLVSKGSHMISFYKAGGKNVRGNSSFKVDKDAFFSCKIEAERNKVDVRNSKLTY